MENQQKEVWVDSDLEFAYNARIHSGEVLEIEDGGTREYIRIGNSYIADSEFERLGIIPVVSLERAIILASGEQTRARLGLKNGKPYLEYVSPYLTDETEITLDESLTTEV